jgi:AcrR family transcriptional regulator
MQRVKKTRRYDSRGRLEQAKRNRDAILDAAARGFSEHGYAGTTIAAIAQLAEVSVETIYKSFGGKPGLVRALYDRGLEGSGAVPAPRRSDETSAREQDPRRILRRWGALSSEVSPLVAPLILLVRAAAATDPELAKVIEDSSAQRLARMRHNARVLADRGFLRDGVTAEEAGDLLWMLTSPEVYELFVLRRGWTAGRYGEFIAETMIAALLPTRAC